MSDNFCFCFFWSLFGQRAHFNNSTVNVAWLHTAHDGKHYFLPSGPHCPLWMEGTGSSWTAEHSATYVERGDGGNDTAPVFEVVLQNSSSTRIPQFAGVELLQSFKLLIIPCYTLVAIVGIFGNYLLLYVICRTRKMHNVINFFIGNLAFSDMLMCATCVPFTLAYAFNPHGWVFGRFMCYLVYLIQPVTVYVSVFTLTAIGVDR